MILGTVKDWNPSQGWGFIEGDDSEDYFLHASKIHSGLLISKNCRVKFDIWQDKGALKQKM